MTGSVPGRRRRAVIRLGIPVVLVAAAAVAALMFPLPPVKEIRNYFGTTGWRGPAAFILA
ncbi:UNVERIFIED_ORG: hypothetical protein ABIB52_004566 [Arthrobacter sp. UYCu721]